MIFYVILGFMSFNYILNIQIKVFVNILWHYDPIFYVQNILNLQTKRYHGIGAGAFLYVNRLKKKNSSHGCTFVDRWLGTYYRSPSLCHSQRYCYTWFHFRLKYSKNSKWQGKKHEKIINSWILLLKKINI